MAVILDTNVAIHLRDGDPDITRNVRELTELLLLSVITWIELEGGVHTNPATAGFRRRRLDAMLRSIPVLPVGEVEARAYRTIIEAAGHSRRKLLDRLIASQAIVHVASLVTCNGADFRDIPGLSLIEW